MERKQNMIRMILCIIMSIAMVLVSELLGEKEILFPEIVALLTGAWAAKKQPWEVTRWQMVLLMAISSVVGVVLVRYVPFPLYGEVLIGYLFVGLCLSIFKSGLAPMISACILPVLMGTESWIYPISVTVMTLMIVGGQKVMEMTGLRQKEEYHPVARPAAESTLYWISRAVLLLLIVIMPIYMSQIYFVAPPLIVVFTEFSNPKSGLRKMPVRIWAMTAAAAFCGAFSRIILCQSLGLPLTAAAVMSVICVFVIFHVGGKPFPPAGALAFLALIIPENALLIYGVEAAIGGAIFLSAAMLVFREKQPSLAKVPIAPSLAKVPIAPSLEIERAAGN